MSDQLQRLRQQRNAAYRNLQLIQQRIAAYVLEIDVPLNLRREEQELQQQIADLDAQINAAGAATPPPAPPEPLPLTKEQWEALHEQIRRDEEQDRQRQRKALDAAEHYQQLGGRAGLTRGRFNAHVMEMEEHQRRELVHILTDPAQLLPVNERLRAASLLAGLGDPRFPVTPDEWREEMARRNEQFGMPDGYWCYVRPGTYRIGGWGEKAPNNTDTSADLALPAFWIARYPVTVAQYRVFMVDGGYQQQTYWTTKGWQWKQQYNRTQPYFWNESEYTSPNQPVIGVTWYEAMAFCGWLTERLGAGATIRLPTEAEWEAAAAYDDQMQQRPYPWGNKPEPTPEHAIFADEQGNRLGAPAPVGVCPAGAAACGALDLAGHVWEWCQSSYKAYPQGAGKTEKDFTLDRGDVPLRGGSWWNNSTYVRCGARVRLPPSGTTATSGSGCCFPFICSKTYVLYTVFCILFSASFFLLGGLGGVTPQGRAPKARNRFF